MLDKSFLFNILFNILFTGNCNNSWYKVYFNTGILYFTSSAFVSTLMPLPRAEIATLIVAHVPLVMMTFAIAYY